MTSTNFKMECRRNKSPQPNGKQQHGHFDHNGYCWTKFQQWQICHLNKHNFRSNLFGVTSLLLEKHFMHHLPQVSNAISMRQTLSNPHCTVVRPECCSSETQWHAACKQLVARSKCFSVRQANNPKLTEPTIHPMASIPEQTTAFFGTVQNPPQKMASFFFWDDDWLVVFQLRNKWKQCSVLINSANTFGKHGKLVTWRFADSPVNVRCVLNHPCCYIHKWTGIPQTTQLTSNWSKRSVGGRRFIEHTTYLGMLVEWNCWTIVINYELQHWVFQSITALAGLGGNDQVKGVNWSPVHRGMQPHVPVCSHWMVLKCVECLYTPGIFSLTWQRYTCPVFIS